MVYKEILNCWYQFFYQAIISSSINLHVKPGKTLNNEKAPQIRVLFQIFIFKEQDRIPVFS
jgi:hypothetical protein